MQKKVHLTLLMMVKNESKRIHVSLESVLGIVDSVTIFDTGSEDNTIEICKSFCEKHNLPLNLKQGEFVDFSTSRNISLDFADSFEEIDYILLLDCNDELKNAENFKESLNTLYEKPEFTAFYLSQEWKSGTVDKYWNTRLVKAREGWRYKGSVHEYMQNENKNLAICKIKGPILFQDRTLDDNKSFERFKRDKILLRKDYEKDPKNTRTIFYLAQTLSCLGEHQEAFDLYLERGKYKNFKEEQFQAIFRAAKIADKNLKLDWEKTLSLYLQSYEILERAEPLVNIAEHYRLDRQWRLSFTFARAACELVYPENTILFVDKKVYDYDRWHILGIVSFYCNRYIEGRVGCEKAIEMGYNKQLDESNLEFYIKNTKKVETNELEEGIQNIINSSENNISNEKLSKKDFIKQKTEELIKKNPNLTRKQIGSKVNKLWKEYRN